VVWECDRVPFLSFCRTFLTEHFLSDWTDSDVILCQWFLQKFIA
jgi:hypothetical protein